MRSAFPNRKKIRQKTILIMGILAALLPILPLYAQQSEGDSAMGRERICIDDGWHFMRYAKEPDTLIYDDRPQDFEKNDDKVADTRAAESTVGASSARSLKNWILPTANQFIKNPASRHQRPQGHPGKNFPFVQKNFNDAAWEHISLPHDWAIKGPFYKEPNAIVGGGMGRLPVQGVAWYRRKIKIPGSDKNKNIYLDIDGAMSYAMVWINGILAGGWPYGYNSFRVDLTPYIRPGEENQLAIRLDNPANSSRWYPGAGIYRNVWLVKTNQLHIAHWGTFIQTKKVSPTSATVDLTIQIENSAEVNANIRATTDIFLLNDQSQRIGNKIASFPVHSININASGSNNIRSRVNIENPLLWGPPPSQKPNRYVAVTRLYQHNKLIDEYETPFGIRDLAFDKEKGLFINGQPVRIQGVNQHHDLGAIGAAFNKRAAERQLELLKEMGCNAIRLAHNPPAPELLDLTDQMGFLVIDEIFDCWEKGKTPLDFHLIFKDWHEADIRSFIRRDRNHPSVIAWSFGNEVGEQYTGEEGAVIAKKLYHIVKDEDSTRPATASMNYAKPDMPFPSIMDIISLNYQGEGIRDAPAYAHLKGIKTPPLYPDFHQKFPGKMIVSSETASALSTRGTYIFPVTENISAPVSDTTGGDPKNGSVSAYDLYTAQFGASPDKVFAAQDHNPFVAGEFVWSGWDYLGEPTPYYTARSSYSGIIDLAGFKKDRFYLYQSRWRPDFPMAHILPHWTWPGRIGKITPVHVYTSGDEAELFLNGKSLGKKKKDLFEYRLRWDSVIYEPGVLKVITYKNGKKWAIDTVSTSGNASKLELKTDRSMINADGKDLSFVTVRILDKEGNLVPGATNTIRFSIDGPGKIIATDNGNPADLTAFPLTNRDALSGKALVIVSGKSGSAGTIIIKANSAGLTGASIAINVQ